LTSVTAIIGDRSARVDRSLASIDPGVLHLEARFSHEKRMEKIAGVFPRTFDLMGRGRPAIELDFAAACPPVAIGRLENARQFHNFLLTRWRLQPPTPRYLSDLSACELACVEARDRSNAAWVAKEPPIKHIRVGPRCVIRRHLGVVLLRCRYDIRALFEAGIIRPPPTKRAITLAIAIPPGAADPRIVELDDTVFDLLAALDDWTERRAFGETPEAQALIADLSTRGLLELSA
jgi:hypothetical protein